MATALGVCVFVRMWHLLVLYAILMGLSASHQQYNPASASMVAESVRREERGTAYGVLMAFSVIVSAITAPLGGLLAMAYGFHPIFYACIAADLLCGLLTWLFIEETLEGAGRTRAQPRREWRDALRGALRPETELRGLYVSMTVVGFAWGWCLRTLRHAGVDLRLHGVSARSPIDHLVPGVGAVTDP